MSGLSSPLRQRCNPSEVLFAILPAARLSSAQEGRCVTFWRPQKPDVFEVMMLARRRVFVRCNDDEYLVVSALLKNTISLTRFCMGDPEPLSITYHDQPVGLFDGKAWDLPALIKWLNSLEER